MAETELSWDELRKLVDEAAGDPNYSGDRRTQLIVMMGRMLHAQATRITNLEQRVARAELNATNAALRAQQGRGGIVGP